MLLPYKDVVTIEMNILGIVMDNCVPQLRSIVKPRRVHCHADTENTVHAKIWASLCCVFFLFFFFEGGGWGAHYPFKP